ncbi:kinase-like protein [Thelephora ganbajun]|uniref:Kinase-like protein n=1 Tax=Thelephora ganbajun TaxID=370292 RepID=A0ACB6ZDT1_THEGA|nr:kinase-like protein [Thelephora ganbajun]
MTPPGPLRQLHDLDRTSPQFHEQLSNYLRGDEYQNVVPSLQGEGLAWLVEYLDSVLGDISDPPSLGFKEFLHELRKICGVKEVLPKSCTFSDSLPDVSIPFASGSTLDGSRLRIKRVKIHPNGQLQKAKQAFHEVAVVWKHLAHPNIAPLLGVTIDPPQLISDRISGGNFMEYITSHPDANRVTLLSDIAEGLDYLHSCDVIHGGLRGLNIIVDTTGRAQITDVGLATVTQNLDSIRDASADDGHSARWIAPEILDDRGVYSKEADIFAFAMITIEAFTGAVPFSDKSPHEAMVAMVGGERPPRPTDRTLTDRLWELIQRCWNQEAHLRPQALEILRAFGIPVWKSLINCPLAMDERISLITVIFSDRKETEAVKRLRGDDAQSFVDVIDEMLGILAPQLRRRCLSALCKTCGRQALLPRSVQIPLCYDRMNPPLYHGGYAEVWKGEHQGREVAVKVVKVYLTSDLDKITRRFCKEVMTWKALCHSNVLPLLGVTMSNNQFTMVSEWMVNGNINEFIKAQKNVNRFELLKDVARGLIYMREEGMIHGDLKGANILIDQHYHACLTDFGLTTIVVDPAYPTTSSSSTVAGTTRWMSPERLDPNQFGFEDSRPTKESDCYALGMTILEVLSGQVPFTRDYNDLMVMKKVLEGEHPGRPQGAEGVWFTDDLWKMLKMCWLPQPKHRPTIEAVFECLKQVSTTWKPLPPRVDGDVETDTDDESFFTISSPVSGSQIPPSPQLLVDPTAGSLTRGSGIITVERTGASRLSPPLQLTPSQPPEELDVEETARIVNRDPRNYLGEHPYLHASNPLPTPDPMRRAISRAGTEQSDGDAGDMSTMLAKHGRLVGGGTSTDSGFTIQETQRPGVPAPVTSQSISASISLMRAANWDGTSQDIDQVLTAAFEAEDYLDCIKNLQARNIDPVLYINNLDKVIDRLATDSDLRKRCIRALSGTCGLYGILPTSHVFNGKLSKPGPRPFASSVTFDVWRLTDEKHQDQVFTVKSLRVCDRDIVKKINEKYCKEVIVSKRMSHPNILSIEGVAPELFKFCMVSQWMERGNILEYVREYPRVDRLELLIGVTRGLDHLHNSEIVHGDLNSPNILIDAEGRPRLYDFANCSFTKSTDLANALTPSYTCTIRWAAPERLDLRVQDRGPTTMSDIYSLSMVIVELVTGKMPFPEYTDHNVIVMISEGERPSKPRHFDAPGMTSAVWKIAQKCWHEKASKRPEVDAVLRSLEALAKPDGKHTQPSLLQWSGFGRLKR